MHAEAGGECTASELLVAALVIRFDVAHSFLREFYHTMGRSLGLAVTFDFIVNVVLLCAQLKVLWVYAAWVVALMPYD